MTVARFPLIGSLTNRNIDAEVADTTDQRLVNCFPDIITNPITGKSSAHLQKRPGRAQSAEVQSGALGSYAAHHWMSHTSTPAVFAFIKSTTTDAMFFNQSGSQLGGDVATTATATCTFISDTLISGTGNLTATIYDGTTAEVWFLPEGGAWTQISDADFPANIQCTHCHLDGFMFVITRGGALYNSDVNSLSAWTSTSFINAQSMPDSGVAVFRYRNLIGALGDYSLEFFYNAGNATGSPLSRVEASLRRVGALRITAGGLPTVRTVSDNVYWLGRDAESGTCGVYRLNGFTPEKISNTTVDKLVAKGEIISIGGAFSLAGLTHIAFLAPSGATILCYCQETKFWWWLVTVGSGALAPSAFIGPPASAGISYFTSTDSARINSFNPESVVWQDNANAYTMTVQTDPIDHGTHARKFFRSLAIIGDTQSAASAVNVSYSDDDYATFSAARSIDMNTTQRRLHRLGAARRRAWKFEHSANTPCRIEAVEIDYEEGAH